MLDPNPVMPEAGQRWRSLIDRRTLTVIEVAATAQTEVVVRFDDFAALFLVDSDELIFDYEPLPAEPTPSA